MTSNFRVLMVCTANHCRSPLAELILRQRLTGLDVPGTRWEVTSAGTHALVGRPMHDHVQQVLGERGVPTTDFTGRQLTEEIARAADLILVASREHRSYVVSLVPAVINRVFTLKQFARLCSAVPERTTTSWDTLGAELIVEARYARSALQPIAPELDDLDDPIGLPIEAYRRCADEITEAVSAMLGPVDRPLPRPEPDARPEISHHSSN
ncbi:hypothetical protein D1871_03915 [Nakamurella silvestris]|nr:hypothetical protein D1871_03915 [Nakamurella silvestris]